jgi:hypothetical protein
MADAAKFVAAFATPIVQSVPHIYLSSIPFAPKRSIIAETFRQKYTKIVSINSGKAINWPAIQNVLHGHSSLSIPSHFRPMDLVSCLAHGTRPFVSGMQRPVMPSVSHSRDIPALSFRRIFARWISYCVWLR